MPTPNSNKGELLAPVGNFEKLEIAIHYGADAIYLGGKDFSLRNFSGNFSLEEIKQAISYAHDRGVKVYVTVNIYARNDQQQGIAAYLEKLGALGPDGVIVADPGVFITARELMPHIPLHLSTQANSTNYKTVEFWERLGIRRVNLARELTLAEIKAIGEQAHIEIEAFVHGAMCIAYSGRCLLSSFMANRHSNRGMCTHPCRWKYTLMEETRAGQYMPIAEDEQGTYIFNSKDLCMIEHIPAMIDSGVAALKIEGRMKGVNYLGTVVKTYREAIDTYYRNPATYAVADHWKHELNAVGRRGYCTGFYFGDPREIIPDYANENPVQQQLFLGKVLEAYTSGKVETEVRNKMFKGECVDVLTRQGPAQPDTVLEIETSDGEPLEFAQPNMKVKIRMNKTYACNDLIRRREKCKK